MSTMTITEGLAEIKTIQKRIEKKRDFILANVVRQDRIKDPLEKQGGSEAVLERELQSIRDLWERLVKIRAAINRANLENNILIEGQTRAVGDWISWKREVAPNAANLWSQMTTHIQNAKTQVAQKGLRSVASAADVQSPDDVIVAVDILKLAQAREQVENVQGILDGALSLKNATILIQIAD